MIDHVWRCDAKNIFTVRIDFFLLKLLYNRPGFGGLESVRQMYNCQLCQLSANHGAFDHDEYFLATVYSVE